MELQSFIDEQVAKKSKDRIIKVSSAINKRWETRIVTQGLDTQGADGARAYLARYGNNIAAPKVIDLALCAQAKGAGEMAMAFWVKAYELTIGSPPNGAGDTVLQAVSGRPRSKAAKLIEPGRNRTLPENHAIEGIAGDQ